MKKALAKLKPITIASALSLILYIATYWLTSALMNSAPKPLYLLALTLYSLVFMGAFALLLIYFSKIRKSTGDTDAMKDFENGYWGFLTDIKFLFRQERAVLLAFALINGASWALISLDKLIFSKRTVTAILLVYAPLNIVGIALPTWANSILGYLAGTVLCFAIYLLELAIFRKKWYRQWNAPQK